MLKIPVLLQWFGIFHCLIHLFNYFFYRRKGHIYAAYADNTFLPFALLLASTFLPPFVLILDLNPWTLDLCLFFGWNVIFIDIHLLIIKGILPQIFLRHQPWLYRKISSESSNSYIFLNLFIHKLWIISLFYVEKLWK